jgi:LysR family transcriptional regulator, hydrogen peroxide-inducible genes activator
MELHQLRYFVAVANLGNFTRAAAKCFVAQPSLSQQIIKLERELGGPVFDRKGKRIRLTDRGRLFYDQAVEILNAVETARRTMSEEDGSGQVRIGAIPTVAPYLLPPLLKRFARDYPKAELMVVENFTKYTIRACLEGDVDVGLLALPIEDERLIVEPLFTEELLLAVAADHPLATKRRITMSDVSAERFVLLDETHCLGEQVVSFCKQHSCQPAVSCQSAQLLTVQEFVALGHGISLIPQMAIDADKSSRRKYRALTGASPKRTIAMIWRRDRSQGPLIKRFIDIARSQARRFSAGPLKTRDVAPRPPHRATAGWRPPRRD